MVQITDATHLDDFIRRHLAHRLTALVSPICRSFTDTLWRGHEDAYRAAKEGSYVMLRLFIEFLGVKGDEKNPGQLVNSAAKRLDDLQLDSFAKFGLSNMVPKDFGNHESLIADIHRALCKINAHFTYDDSESDPYNRIVSLEVNHWAEATKIVVMNLDDRFYRPLQRAIVVQSDIEVVFRQRFGTGLQSAIRGDTLYPPPSWKPTVKHLSAATQNRPSAQQPAFM